MITEIRNKINSIGETVTTNFFYESSGSSESLPRCVYSFFANEVGDLDTESQFEDIYFQISCYQRTDGLVESLADSIETAFNSADLTTTNYRCLRFRKLRRRPFPAEVEVKGEKRIIIEYYVYYEKI